MQNPDQQPSESSDKNTKPADKINLTAEKKIHCVQTGETLEGIAKKTNNSIANIKALNTELANYSDKQSIDNISEIRLYEKDIPIFYRQTAQSGNVTPALEKVPVSKSSKSEEKPNLENAARVVDTTKKIIDIANVGVAGVGAANKASIPETKYGKRVVKPSGKIIIHSKEVINRAYKVAAENAKKLIGGIGQVLGVTSLIADVGLAMKDGKISIGEFVKIGVSFALRAKKLSPIGIAMTIFDIATTDKNGKTWLDRNLWENNSIFGKGGFKIW